MKKIGIVAGGILLLIIVGIFIINTVETEIDVTQKQTKVGVILNGKKDDRNWSQSHYEGMEQSAEKLNLKVLYEEEVAEDESCKAVMEKLIEDGCEIIICNSFSYGEWELEVAKKHPEIYFFHATGTKAEKNLATYFGRIYQMRYLSGIVAGMQTETNCIGYVAAYPIPEVNRGLNAFTLGVRAVNPDANVYVEWCDSWGNDQKAAEATERLLGAQDIDVLAMHSDSLAVMKIAEERGIWSIGYNVDNSENYPKTFLTAPVWQWEKFYEPRILECLQGKFQGKHYWESADSGVVTLAPLTANVKDGIAEVVAKEQARLQSGTFDVFYGPVRDQDGVIRIHKGESMTDEAMLNEFNWYVEGVVLNEK